MHNQELFQVLENPEDLALDESVTTLKELCGLINIDKMGIQDKMYINEIVNIIDGMEIPILINEGEA